jgi:hypothetical protein
MLANLGSAIIAWTSSALTPAHWPEESSSLDRADITVSNRSAIVAVPSAAGLPGPSSAAVPPKADRRDGAALVEVVLAPLPRSSDGASARDPKADRCGEASLVAVAVADADAAAAGAETTGSSVAGVSNSHHGSVSTATNWSFSMFPPFPRRCLLCLLRQRRLVREQ